MEKRPKLSIMIEQRPNYYRGQLLLEDDFLAEQHYHVNARLNHNMHLHGWGVVHGLQVSGKSGNSITITPGFAVDVSGHEIFIKESQNLTLYGFEPNEWIVIGLTYHDIDGFSESDVERSTNRQNSYASITASRKKEKKDTLTLAKVQLDDHGDIREDSIDYSETNFLRVLAQGSITCKELHPDLRKGWVRLPFRPQPLVNFPEGETEIPPMFRVGATESMSKDSGAAGTMAIPIPPLACKVLRLRIAGSQNKGEISLELLKGGWDPINKKHIREKILKEIIKSTRDIDWFEETFHISENLLDSEYNTLCLWLRGTHRTAVSIVAVEFAF